MRAALVFAAALLPACAEPSPSEVEHASLDTLEFDVPAGWSRGEPTLGRTGVWTPSGENPRKESITITRTEPRPTMAKAGHAVLARYLREAQGSLRGGSFGRTSHFTSGNGFAGVSVEGTFTPFPDRTYRRTHAVLVDGTSLVHVIYTSTDPRPEALQLVINSLQRKDA